MEIVRITKFAVNSGLDVVPTVTMMAQVGEGVHRASAECPKRRHHDIYALVAMAVNDVTATTDVAVVTRNTTTIRKGGQRRERATVRVRRGSWTTANTGAEDRDPLRAFLKAYVAALNAIFKRTGVKTIVRLASKNRQTARIVSPPAQRSARDMAIVD